MSTGSGGDELATSTLLNTKKFVSRRVASSLKNIPFRDVFVL
jgi:hypothetical protein